MRAEVKFLNSKINATSIETIISLPAHPNGSWGLGSYILNLNISNLDALDTDFRQYERN